MSKHKAGGSTKLGRDSESKRLGVKAFGGQKVKAGAIIVRQKGTRFSSGVGTGTAKDHSIFATEAGVVQFSERVHTRYTGARRKQMIISIQK